MKKIPDRVTMDKSALDMDHVIPSDEMGEIRRSDLVMPVLYQEYFAKFLYNYLKYTVYDQWRLLKDEIIDTDMFIQLLEMCDEFLHAVHNIVLDYVAPQVLARLKLQIFPDDRSTSTETRNYYRVTANDMKAILGDSFHYIFGAALEVKLVELVAEELKDRVNRSLTRMGEPDSLRETEGPAPQSNLQDTNARKMAFIIAGILRKMFLAPDCQGSQDTHSTELSCLEEVRSLEYDSEDEQGSQNTDSSELSSLEEVTSLEEDDDSEEDATEFSASSAEELPQREKTFLDVFLVELVELIADSTKTSVFEVDFEGMMARLREKTAGESKSTLPQTVGNIPILIFKELCQEFGSAKLLQSAMVSSDMAFEEAVAELLKAKLQKSEGETSVGGFSGKKTSKSCSGCEVLNKENGSTPPPERKKKRPAIVRMFSSMARILRRPFTCCCSSSGSLDD